MPKKSGRAHAPPQEWHQDEVDEVDDVESGSEDVDDSDVEEDEDEVEGPGYAQFVDEDELDDDQESDESEAEPGSDDESESEVCFCAYPDTIAKGYAAPLTQKSKQCRLPSSSRPAARCARSATTQVLWTTIPYAPAAKQPSSSCAIWTSTSLRPRKTPSRSAVRRSKHASTRARRPSCHRAAPYRVRARSSIRFSTKSGAIPASTRCQRAL